MSKTVLITGVSSGLGLAMATEALARGHRVLGTLRDEAQRKEFESRAPGQAFGRLLDVTNAEAIQPLPVRERIGLLSPVEIEFGKHKPKARNLGRAAKYGSPFHFSW